MGRAGQELNKILLQLDLLDRVYITNVCKCRPPKNRKPEEVEREICGGQYLAEEIDLIRPKVIVALGVTAAEFINRGKPWARGELKYVSRWGSKVIVTWHPSYVLRFASQTAKEQLIEAMRKAKGAAL